MICQFRGCDGEIKYKRDNYMYCEKHTCSECAKVEFDDWNIWRIVHFKVAHHVRDNDKCCITACGSTSVIMKFYSETDYCDIDKMCDYKSCEKQVEDNSIRCVTHIDLYCRVCNATSQYSVCKNCRPKIGRCCVCQKYYKRKFMVGYNCLFCYREDKSCYQISLKYIDNVPQIQNPLDYTKLRLYYRRSSHPIFSLPYEVFMIIMSYTSLPPSYISLETFLNYIGQPTTMKFLFLFFFCYLFFVFLFFAFLFFVFCFLWG